MLKDSFGRVHDYLRVSLTDRCNFRCLYCLPLPEHQGLNHASHAETMTAEEIIGISKIFVDEGVRKIRLTGGEPLVRRDAGEIMEALGKLPARLFITTNGSRIHEFKDSFVRSGITSINVSLDTLDAGNFLHLTQKNEFEKVMQNIRFLITAGYHVKINMVVMKGYNDHEIEAFVRLTQNDPIHLRFIEFMPFQGNQWRPAKLMTYSEILQQISSAFDGVEKLEDGPHDTTKKYRIRNHAGTFAVISTMSEPFCSGCNRLRLTADGKLRNCLFAKTETDLLQPYRKGEDIRQLIHSTLKGKHFQLGGNSGETWAMEETGSGIRTMMGIGG